MKKTLIAIICFFAFTSATHAQTLYGTTLFGGSGKTGTINKFNALTNTLTVTKSLQSIEKNPEYTNLVQASDGKLYGMTSKGGSSGAGVIFSFDPSSSTYAKVQDFDNTIGASPYGSLVQASDGKLYGMTSKGGSSFNAASNQNGYGVIFSFDPSSSTYTTVLDFNYTNGGFPYGSLVQASDGKLYGMTSEGGSSGAGVLFSFDPSSSTYAKVQDFNYTIGTYPRGSLVQASDGKLYGMTQQGGSSGAGVIFSFDPSSSAYAKVQDFDYTNGAYPFGSLVQASNGKLYGMTYQGGSSSNVASYQYGYGVVFSFNPSSFTYTKVQDFDGTNGVNPFGSLVQASNGKLYGMTVAGGSSFNAASYEYGPGVLFSIDPSSSTYTKVQDFDGTNGANPDGSLMEASDGKLYGMTYAGGSGSDAASYQNGYGVIFSFDPSSSTYTKKKDFAANTTGSSASASLVQASNGKLYGMTNEGGSSGSGVIFSFDTSSSTYTKVLDFGGTNGANPYGSLMEASDGKLYGMTYQGGSSNSGVIFSFDPSSSAYAKAQDFDYANGANPVGSLVQASNGKLYGMTNEGGSSGAGVIFSFDPSSSMYTKVLDFDGTNGASPYGSLVQASDGKLYGMTFQGGSSGYGVIFSFDPSSSTYIIVLNFDLTNGGLPFGSLVQASDGKLYGMTYYNGSGYGAIFSFDPSSSTYTKVQDFGGTNGVNPMGSLVQASDGKLYGTTFQGGSSGAGVIFSFDPSSSTYTKMQDFDGTNGAGPYIGSAFIEGKQTSSHITTSVNSNNFCAGSSLNVAYTATGSYGSANFFTAQLSNASGSFTSTQTPPTNIGTVTATASGTIEAVIPTTTTAGTGYRVRVVASDPVVIGTDNGADIAITALATFYPDGDGDGYGDISKPVQACSAPQGSVTYVTDNTDCDDSKLSVHPGAVEVCNGIDDDCDGQIDEGLPTVTYYRDADGDGYGNAAISTTYCSQPGGYVTNSFDCDDSKSSVHPGAVEICANGIDDNCNGQIDENCGSVPRISINDVTVYESEGVAVLTISLDRVSTSAISVKYATQNGTAIGSGKGVKTFDFTSASSSVTIPAGTKTAQIRITITKDNITEAAENFRVNLSLDTKNVKKATITKSSGTVTINALTSTQSRRIVQPAEDAAQSLALDVSAYPNPSTSSFTVKVSSNNKKDVISMTVIDMNGRVIEKRNNLTAGQTLQIGSGYRPGIYFLQMLQGKARTHVKLLKAVY